MVFVILTGLVLANFNQAFGFEPREYLSTLSKFNDGNFDMPQNLAFDSIGNIYVVDAGNNRIQKFDSEGNFILKWGSEGKFDGEFICPYGIIVDSDDLVYVSDFCKQNIQIFDNAGNFISKWGKPGSGSGYLLSPSSIVFDHDQNLIVVDDTRSTIQKFSKSGEFISIWKTDREDVCPTGGTTIRLEPCKFGISDITVNGNGDFFIIKRLSNSIEKISTSGERIDQWDLVDKTTGTKLIPVGIAVDSSGNLYVTNSDRAFLYKFSSDGEYISKWLRKDITHPHIVRSVKVDDSDNVYVLFLGDHLVEKYDSQGKLVGKIGSVTFDNSGLSVYSPLKQLQIGVPKSIIGCKDNLVPVLSFREFPSCVKQESIVKLVQRGWITNTVIQGGSPIECYQTPNPGVCNAVETKYYFDWESLSCKSFSWNGCRGTIPFDYLDECKSLCLP